MLHFRLAHGDDVPEISRVLIASITQLCALDHKNDPAAIAAWLTNKSEAGVSAMLIGGVHELYVATRDREIVGVAALSTDTITLNYVAPAHQHTGVSSGLLHALEAILVKRGFAFARLTSTATARSFYLSRGWIEDRAIIKANTNEFPMHKRLMP